MDNELDALILGDTDLEKPTVRICADQHHEITEVGTRTQSHSNPLKHVFVMEGFIMGLCVCGIGTDRRS